MEEGAEVGRVEKTSSRRGELDEVEAKQGWATWARERDPGPPLRGAGQAWLSELTAQSARPGAQRGVISVRSIPHSPA